MGHDETARAVADALLAHRPEHHRLYHESATFHAGIRSIAVTAALAARALADEAADADAAAAARKAAAARGGAE